VIDAAAGVMLTDEIVICAEGVLLLPQPRSNSAAKTKAARGTSRENCMDASFNRHEYSDLIRICCLLN